MNTIVSLKIKAKNFALLPRKKKRIKKTFANARSRNSNGKEINSATHGQKKSIAIFLGYIGRFVTKSGDSGDSQKIL